MSKHRRKPATSPDYPLGIVIAYGPDNKTGTKLVASIISEPQGEITAMDKWIVEGGDIREVPSIKDEVGEFFNRHQVKKTMVQEKIAGCPHEEGIDYPMGRKCPHCPFWHGIDRITHEPIKEPLATRSVDEVLNELSVSQDVQPLLALESADAHREALTEPLLNAIEDGLNDPTGEEDATLFTYALYLFAKWRETRAYPLVVRWLALPGKGAEEISGDIVTQDGSKILAAVCDGNLEPIKELIQNREADEFCRVTALDALGLLAVWAEVPRELVGEYLVWLAGEGLEREESYAWDGLASTCIDMELLSVFPYLRTASEEGLIDQELIVEIDEVEKGKRGSWTERMQDRNPPITDVAEATRWWGFWGQSKAQELARQGMFEDTASDSVLPYIAPPKVGRNDPCPCGSGKKFKKCCGK